MQTYIQTLWYTPLSSNIVDFILPGWRQIYIATAQNWPATWQTRPTETSEMVVLCTCTPCWKFCTPTFKILPNTLMPTHEKSISHCAIFWIDLTPGPEAPKNNYKYISTKTTDFGQSFFPKTLKDWNKLDNETKESSTTLEYKNSLWTSHH